MLTTSAEFSVGLVVFLICRSPLYIREINLLVVYITNISSQIVAYLLILFMIFFVELKI